jgi:cell division protein FtsQ
MDRSLTARPGRPFGLGGARRAGRDGKARDQTRRSRMLRAFTATLADGRAFVWRRRRLRMAVLGLLISLPLVIGGWMWLRDSPLVSVEHVRVVGVHASSARQIDAALTAAARHMTTLHVHLGALRAAVAPFRVVRDLRVSSSFPHGLRIRVIEQPPVAVLEVAGQRTAVAADGVVLGPGLLGSALPSISGGSVSFGAAHVHNASLLAELSVLGAAPSALLGWVARVYNGREGLTVAMRDGLTIYFGDANRPHAKWMSAARVLADPTSAGAVYLDVRLPERPAAGTASGSSSQSSSAIQVSASDPTAAALAATLASAVNGSSGGATSSDPSETSATTASGATPATPLESTSSTPASTPIEAPSGSTAGSTESASATPSAGTGAEATSPSSTGEAAVTPGG